MDRAVSIEYGKIDPSPARFVSPKLQKDYKNNINKEEDGAVTDVWTSKVKFKKSKKNKEQKVATSSRGADEDVTPNPNDHNVNKKTSRSRKEDPSEKVITEEESSNFFVHDYAEGESKLLLHSLQTKDEDEEKEEEEKSDENEKSENEEKQKKDKFKDKFKSDDMFWLRKKSNLTEKKDPKYFSKKDKILDDLHNLFLPSFKQQISSRKSPKDEKEENKKKEIPARRININIMENRAIKQERRNMVTEDGQIILGANPVSEPMTRSKLEEEEDNPLCEFVHACPLEEFNTLFEWRMRSSTTKGVFQLNIGGLRFTSHPFLSEEHRIAFELMTKVETFTERATMHITELLRDKLLILRKSLKKLKKTELSEEIPRGRNSVRRELDISRRRKRYKQEIKETRNALIKEGKIDRDLTSSILSLWKDLKEMRNDTGFQATDFQLTIHKKEPKKKKIKEELKMLEEELEEESKEIIEEEEECYKKKYQLFEKELKEWKEDNKQRKIATKRKDKLERKNHRKLNEEQAVQLAQDQITLSKSEEPKPTPPSAVDKDKIKKEVEENFLESRRPPGEPVLDFEMSRIPDSITQTKLCPASERQRRNVVSRTKIWLKIRINNKLVTEVSPLKLNDNFIIAVSTPLLIEVVSWPYEIRIDVHEGPLAFNQELKFSFTLPIPTPENIEEGDSTFDIIDFSSTKNSKRKSSFRKFPPNQIYAGKFSCKLFWKSRDDGTTLIPPGSPIKSVSKNKEIENKDLSNPNPYVDDNQITEVLGDKSSEPLDLFGSDEAFCTEEELDMSVRLRVLRLRNQGMTEFKDMKFVPSLESQVLKKTLENYENKMAEEGISPVGGTDEYEENERKTQADTLVQAILRKLEEQIAQAKEPVCLRDIVKEEEIPNIGSIGELLSILKPKRPLKPVRRKRDQVRGIGLNNQNVKLIVHITRGFHIPLRQDINISHEESVSSSEVSDSKHESWANVVRPFVEVSFQKSSGRTHSSQGSSPTWNEQLMLPFKPPNNDFTTANLQSIEDNIYFHLFDEIVFDLLEDERKRKTTIFHQVEKRWLGSIKIPFSTVYLNGKIEGTFRLDCPTLMLGYAEDESLSGKGNPLNIEAPHLSIYLTLEPTLPPLEPFKEIFESAEPEEVIKEGKEFVASLVSRFPHRHYRTHVLDLFGELVALNRFIKPLEPPKEIIGRDKDQEVQRISWYVSLLPCLSSTKNNGGIPKLWANADQFVNLGIGNTDEKAILLTNFLIHLDYDALLLIGSGIPDGISSYVLVKLKNVWNVICPGTSIIFEISHPISPLKSVFMLIDEDNIYANNQKFDDPPRMNFDLSSTSHWKPFYSKSFSNPGLASIQPEAIVYQPVKEDVWKELKKRLRIVLRDAFMKWRPLHRTPWNAHLTKILQRLLRTYETCKLNGKNPVPNYSDLETMMNAYEICGVCIQQNYTTMEAVVEAVFSSGIHCNYIPGMEFALSLEIFSYPGEAASVWVYVASLSKRQ